MDTLFFVVSKFVWLVIQPENWIIGLLVLAFWALQRHHYEFAKWIIASTLGLFLIIGSLPIGQLLVRPLESRFPTTPPISNPAAIIVLGGEESAEMSVASGLPEINTAAERLVMGAALAKQFADADLVFTGGSASLLGQSVSGALGVQFLFDSFELSGDRVLLEPKACNTAENASRTRGLMNDITEGPWVLVTSAFHMPRSVGAFCAAGWREIIPYPVDYRAADQIGFGWSFVGNLDLLGIAIKEWIGLVVYRVTGRTAALIPENC